MICYAIKNKYGEYILDPDLMSEDKPLFAKQLNHAFLGEELKYDGYEEYSNGIIEIR